jgi:BA14K-like protein
LISNVLAQGDRRTKLASVVMAIGDHDDDEMEGVIRSRAAVYRDRDAGIRTGRNSGAGRVPSGANDAYAYMGESANVSSCSQRYRSFDPASGTFLGYDGHRHSCQ